MKVIHVITSMIYLMLTGAALWTWVGVRVSPKVQGEHLRRIQSRIVSCWAFAGLILLITDEHINLGWSFVSEVRWHDIVLSMAVISAVFIARYFLLKIKCLDRGVFSSACEDSNASIPKSTSNLWNIFIACCFIAAIPLASLYEEWAFRAPCKTWLSAMGMSVVFGLAHCLVGVKYATGLALSVAGLWFSYCCFLGGIPLSSKMHAIYNLILMSSWLLILLLISAIQLFAPRKPELGVQNKGG